MDIQFNTHVLDYLKCIQCEIQNSEQTQELRLTDGMPDVGSVIQAWGQPIMRGKEWHSDEVSYSGGMMVWILYSAEGRDDPQVLSTWIPFQIRWDLPENLPDGDIRVSCLTRFVDARSISPRKIMIRCGMAAMCEVYIPDKLNTYSVAEHGGEIEVLRNKYSLKMCKYAGEKTFLMDEELTVPESVPVPKKIVYCALDCRLQDSRVLSDKLVFRGQGNLHMLYLSENGQLHSWDFELPFSQLAELRASYSSEAVGDLRLAVTNMEEELNQNGNVRLKCAMVAQYLIVDKETIEIIEDAYSIGNELKLQQEILPVPVILEQKKDVLHFEHAVQVDADIAADVRFLPDYPVVRGMGDQLEMRFQGCFQMVCYGSDGKLSGVNSRWEGQEQLNAAESVRLQTYPHSCQPQSVVGNGTVTLKAEIPVDRTAVAEQSLSMVTDIEVGQERQKDSGRPSLMIMRAGNARLWDIAKDCGSTVDAILTMNQLSEEAFTGKMLLIPIS